MPSSSLFRACSGAGLIILMTAGAPAHPIVAAGQSDLDAFMQQVVARRDDNWKKLQQYVLDEREEFDLRGPGNVRMWGEQRDYTWFIRDGFFVRSPIKFNGVTIGDAERRKAEDEYLSRARRRDARAGGTGAPPDTAALPAVPAPEANDAETLNSVDGLIRQSRQPQFVSSAYFLRFKFDEGTYALVGREQFEGRDVLRIEYYPTKLFSNDRPEGRAGNDANRRNARRRPHPEPGSKEARQEAELRRVLNKVALVTLWIEPASHQIVKYTFDNVDFDFLPLPWLVKVNTAKASMTMGQPFPEVWLPRALEWTATLTFAVGDVTLHYSLDYTNYRQADAKARLVPNDIP
jgi:hypothetical protein